MYIVYLVSILYIYCMSSIYIVLLYTIITKLLTHHYTVKQPFLYSKKVPTVN